MSPLHQSPTQVPVSSKQNRGALFPNRNRFEEKIFVGGPALDLSPRCSKVEPPETGIPFFLSSSFLESDRRGLVKARATPRGWRATSRRLLSVVGSWAERRGARRRVCVCRAEIVNGRYCWDAGAWREILNGRTQPSFGGTLESDAWYNTHPLFFSPHPRYC